ncbi:MAG: hypothetical protein H6772_04365 [Pseudomonadales bacterium]|nr:hypothetical protein [Pseudomonadales bacterium]
MLSIPHAITGAFIASKLPHPALYIPLTIGMHYLEDWIPHWDVGTGLSSGKRKRSTAIMLELVELVICVGLIYYFFRGSDSNLVPHIWMGALFGIVPDLIESPRNFLKWEPWFFKPFNKLHGSFHHSTHNIIVGLLPQFLVLVAIWFLR